MPTDDDIRLRVSGGVWGLSLLTNSNAKIRDWVISPVLDWRLQGKARFEPNQSTSLTLGDLPPTDRAPETNLPITPFSGTSP
jgi:hypothetical protein